MRCLQLLWRRDTATVLWNSKEAALSSLRVHGPLLYTLKRSFHIFPISTMMVALPIESHRKLLPLNSMVPHGRVRSQSHGLSWSLFHKQTFTAMNILLGNVYFKLVFSSRKNEAVLITILQHCSQKSRDKQQH